MIEYNYINREVNNMLYNSKRDVNDCFQVVETTIPIQSREIQTKNISDIKIKGKTLICLCGNNTRDPLRAKQYAAYGFRWLTGCKEKEDITAYSVFYPHEQPLFTNLSQNPAFDYNALSEEMFGQIINADGKKQSVEEIIKTFGQTVFFGHSVGGLVMNELMEGLKKLLRENEFSPAEIEKVYKSIVFVAYSPYQVVDAPINAIYIAPVYDSIGSTMRAYAKVMQNGGVCSDAKFIEKKEELLSQEYYMEFLDVYEHLMGNRLSAYYLGGNTLCATPNLLYGDGAKEDHGMAGIIGDSPFQTEAGKTATKFLKECMRYSFSEDRSMYNLGYLYNYALLEMQNNDTNISEES